MKHDAETTHDTLFGGALELRQPARKTGYRVNVDALLLASFVGQRRVKHAVDLGSGVGAVGLSLLHLGVARRVSMVENDSKLAELAKKNAEANGWADRVFVQASDVRDLPGAIDEPGDLVVCNPPYVAPGRGREPNAAVRAAKYGDLEVFIEAARVIAGRRARIAFVYPAIEATALLATMSRHGIEPKRLRAVHGRERDPARVVLVEGACGKRGGLAIEPPLIETEAGKRTAELTRLLSHPRVER